MIKKSEDESKSIYLTSSCRFIKVSKIYFRNIRPDTICLYSNASILPLRMSAFSQRKDSICCRVNLSDICAQLILDQRLGRGWFFKFSRLHPTIGLRLSVYKVKWFTYFNPITYNFSSHATYLFNVKAATNPARPNAQIKKSDRQITNVVVVGLSRSD